MKNTEKLVSIFAESLGIPKDRVQDDLSYNSIPEWDSISHMALIAAIDSAFDIMMETEDVIDMSSLERAREILKKYGIEF